MLFDAANVPFLIAETGLSMCHIYGINNRALRPDSIPSVEWRDLRNTWRTLIFFSRYANEETFMAVTSASES